jgi:hypothetical protein
MPHSQIVPCVRGETYLNPRRQWRQKPKLKLKPHIHIQNMFFKTYYICPVKRKVPHVLLTSGVDLPLPTPL